MHHVFEKRLIMPFNKVVTSLYRMVIRSRKCGRLVKIRSPILMLKRMTQYKRQILGFEYYLYLSCSGKLRIKCWSNKFSEIYTVLYSLSWKGFSVWVDGRSFLLDSCYHGENGKTSRTQQAVIHWIRSLPKVYSCIFEYKDCIQIVNGIETMLSCWVS